MTSPVERWREMVAKATPGARKRVLNLILSDEGGAPVAHYCRTDDDAELIVRSDVLARFLASDDAVERIARVIDPEAFWTVAQWREYLGVNTADKAFGRFQASAVPERMEGRRKGARVRAEAVRSTLCSIALSEEPR